MEYSKLVAYTFARIGMLILISAFSAFCGAVLFPSIITLFPASMSDFKEFMTKTTTQSFIGFVIVVAVLAALFWTDGKKHTAYETWSVVNISIVEICMLLAYFIPSIFRDSFVAEGRAELFYKIFYYPCLWLFDENKMNFMAAVMIGAGILLIIAFIAYFLSYKVYVKKHNLLCKSVY